MSTPLQSGGFSEKYGVVWMLTCMHVFFDMLVAADVYGIQQGTGCSTESRQLLQ
jgi:hypothetical protein